MRQHLILTLPVTKESGPKAKTKVPVHFHLQVIAGSLGMWYRTELSSTYNRSHKSNSLIDNSFIFITYAQKQNENARHNVIFETRYILSVSPFYKRPIRNRHPIANKLILGEINLKNKSDLRKRFSTLQAKLEHQVLYMPVAHTLPTSDTGRNRINKLKCIDTSAHRIGRAVIVIASEPDPRERYA